jgi:hypothetical protein
LPKWQQQQQPEQEAPASPAVITKRIMSAENPAELLQAVVLHHQLLNPVHIAAALNQAAALWPKTSISEPALVMPADQQQGQQQSATATSAGSSIPSTVGRQQLERLMLQLAGPFLRALPHYSCREICTGLWAYAKYVDAGRSY